MKTILVVDDDRQILNAVSRMLMDTPYEIRLAESGQEGLECLSREEIQVVVSDMRMPGMDGRTFLAAVKQRWPLTMRIALSGYADESIVLDSIQRSIAMVYVHKPWKNDGLVSLIEKLLESQEVLASNPFFPSFDGWSDFPTIPAVHRQLLDKLDGDISLKLAADAIEADPTICAKILHIANTAFYGLQTGSVRHAVKCLGLRLIRPLVLSTAVMDMFADERRNEAIERLWRHSSLTSVILHSLYMTLLRTRLPDTASAAGLLHNIGSLYLLWRYRNHLGTGKSMLQANGQIDLLPDEEKNLGISHSAAGGFLLRLWEMPYDIVEAALYHHSPCDRRIVNSKLLAALHVAQHLAARIIGQPPVSSFQYTECIQILGISTDEMDAFADDPLGRPIPDTMRYATGDPHD